MSILYIPALLILLYGCSAVATGEVKEQESHLTAIFNCVIHGDLYEDGTVEVLGIDECKKQILDFMKQPPPKRKEF